MAEEEALFQEVSEQSSWWYSDEELSELLVYTLLVILFVTPFLRYPKASFRKAQLFVGAFLFRFFGKDMRWPPTADVEELLQTEVVERKRLILIRHGESTWNDVFNRSLNPIKFIPRLVGALVTEFSYFFNGSPDSWFYDAPLIDEGFHQAEELARFLEKADPQDADVQALLGTPQAASGGAAAVVVSSPLRRCLSTVAVGLTASLAPKGQRVIKVLPALQEISCNPDTLAITPVKTAPVPSTMEQEQRSYPLSEVYAHCDVSSYDKTKPITGSGLTRLQSFVTWVFCPNGGAKSPAIVVSGHSFWFRFFFRTYLPRKSTHQSKQMKICNGGAVGITLLRNRDGKCWIDESSIRVITGAFVK